MCISQEQFTATLEASEKRIKEHMDLMVKPIIATQKEHHASLYNAKFGLRNRVQKIENYSTATLVGVGLIVGVIGGILSFRDRVLAWFS